MAALVRQLGYETTLSEVEERLARILERSDHAFLLAEADGRPVGWVHAVTSEFVEAERVVVIGGLVVDREHRRQGIGKALMQAAEDWAGSQGCSIVRLRSSTGRTAAHRFYEQLGYANVKTQYSFVKSLEKPGQAGVKRFAPRIEE